MVLVLKKGASQKQIDSIAKKLKNKSGIDVLKYCGKIKLKEDALMIQKKLRNEWVWGIVRY
jgi:ribonuclease HIII